MAVLESEACLMGCICWWAASCLQLVTFSGCLAPYWLLLNAEPQMLWWKPGWQHASLACTEPLRSICLASLQGMLGQLTMATLTRRLTFTTSCATPQCTT